MGRQIDISDDLERAWDDWLQQRAVRLDQGDDLTQQRVVDHFLLHRWKWAARRSIRVIHQTRDVGLLRSDIRPRWIVQASAMDDLTDASVRHSLEYMLTMAARDGALYDGFGAPVVAMGPDGSDVHAPNAGSTSDGSDL